nr:microtubule-associated tumor suppressor candidate 2-like [Zootoca vivipara]
MKNNNERMVTVGDTNANQITPEVRTSGRELRTNDLSGETRCRNTGETENNTQLDSERNRLQGTTTGLSEFRLHSTTSRELHKDYRTDGVKDTAKLLPISRGHSLSNLRINTNETFSVVLSKSDADLIQHVSKERAPRRIEPEGIKRLSLGRSRKLMAKTEAFGKEFVGRVSGKRLLSASLDSIDTSHHLIGDMERSRKTSTDHFLGVVFRPTDSASEGNIVRYSKPPSTSETKKPNVAATNVADNIANFNKQSTPHPAHIDLHLTVKPTEIWSRSEAQVDHQGDKRGKAELKSPLYSQSQSMCQQKIDRNTPVEFLGHQMEENNVAGQNKKDYGSEVYKGKSHQLQEACRKAENPYLNEDFDSASDRLVSNSNNSQGLRKGGSLSDSRSMNQVSACISEKEEDSALPFAGDSKHSGKLTPTRNKNLHDTDASCTQAAGGHMPLMHNTNLPDCKLLNSNESKLVKGNSDVAMLTSDQPNAFSAENASDGHSNIQGCGLDATSVSVLSKKTVIVKRNLSSDTPESCKIPGRTDTFLCAPTPLRPVAAVNVSNHTTASSSGLKGLYTLHVDKLPPSAVLPPIDDTQLLSLSPKVPNKTPCNSGIPKPILIHTKGSHLAKDDEESNGIEKPEDKPEIKPDIPKPKHVRPKIITYIRRNPQAVSHLDHAFAPAGLPYVAPPCSMPMGTEQKALNDGDIKPGTVLYDKFKPDLQKPRIYSSGLVVSGIKSPSHHFGQMGEKFIQEVGERPVKGEFCPPPYTNYEVPPSFYRSAMILRPQLGLGAVSRLPSAKSRILITSQRSSASCIHPQGPIASSPPLFHPDNSVDLKKGPNPNATKSNLPKPCQSGLRPPGYSRLPAAKLAAFGFVRSSSVSSVSSNQSNDSVQSDQSRTANSSKKEAQKDQEANRPTVSSPKRLVVSSTKLHSPGHPKQRSPVPRNGFSTKPDLQTREAERQLIQQMKEKCDEQAKKFSCIQEELKRTGCGFDVFVITTQHFFQKHPSIQVLIVSNFSPGLFHAGKDTYDLTVNFWIFESQQVVDVEIFPRMRTLIMEKDPICYGITKGSDTSLSLPLQESACDRRGIK